jgi:tRNA threonylcarbamoyladenosine biosynthesis protein TsaE
LEWIYLSDSEEDTEVLGEELGARLLSGAVVLLDGELGAGKTVFSRGVARGLGVTAPIQSPTFTLMNAHTGRLPFYHFDLYRLESEDELFDLGMDEILDGDGVTLIEWAGKFSEYFTVPAIYVRISVHGLSGRQISMHADEKLYQTILSELPSGGQTGEDTRN